MKKKRSIKTGITLLISVALTGCVSPKYNSQQVSTQSRLSAQQEIRNLDVSRRNVSDARAERKVRKIYRELEPYATSLCRQLAEGSCTWEIEYSTDNELNAFAAGQGKIVIKKGVIQYASNDDEIAMVIAHEMSHHVANHINETVQNATTGMVVGGLLAGAIGAYAYSDSAYRDQRIINSAVTGGGIGAMAGRLRYSKAQENEADYLSAYIIHNSGYDLKKARTIFAKLAKAGKTEHGERHSVGTHPDPAERLARWDVTTSEIARKQGRFYGR
jgi:predicted Zn-dependent protease